MSRAQGLILSQELVVPPGPVLQEPMPRTVRVQQEPLWRYACFAFWHDVNAPSNEHSEHWTAIPNTEALKNAFILPDSFPVAYQFCTAIQ